MTFNIKEIIHKYIGVCYADPQNPNGLKCWGLVRSVYRDYGIELPSFENYENEHERILKGIDIENYYKLWKRVDVPIAGDVVVMPNPRMHVGLYLEYGKFIHAHHEAKVSLARVSLYKGNIEGFYRYRE